MKKELMIFSMTVFLAGCASPIESMTAQQVSTLSDSQLCYSDGIHRKGEKTRQEIQRRNLNCDPAFRYCMDSGFTPGTNPFLGCLQMRAQQDYHGALIEQQQQEQNPVKSYMLELPPMQPPKSPDTATQTHCSAYDNGPFGSGLDCASH